MDLNGCGVMHWAAHGNNKFLLKLFHKAGLPLNEVDKQGFTPMVRALMNNSYKTIKYLAKWTSEPLP